ncbi:MAG: [protein-PII] uridylyltransferase [Candidatus Dadabacteria bacterium]|nr:[protein-PII] uridylyltransferase [Candidatus Dadabacteria bacterium]
MRETETKEKELLTFFTDSYEHIRRRHYSRTRKNKAMIGYELARERSMAVDNLIRRALQSYGYTQLKGACIVALGGYGREELSPYSDIDLLFLHGKGSKDLVEEVTQRLLYLLWDTRLDVGNCMRNVEECMELSMDRNDVTILSSLLDSRFICGDRGLYEELENEIYGEVLPKISNDFTKRKIEERDSRLEKYGKTLYLLEPNVKEGQGGLREFQTAMWIAQASYKAKSFEDLLHRGFVSEKEYRVMRKCLNFLLLVRAQLHYQAKKRDDNLSFEYQSKAAQSFGYRDGKIRAVEKFMRIYYLRAAVVVQQSRRLTEKCTRVFARRRLTRKAVHLNHGFIIQGKHLSVTSRNVFSEDFCNFLRAFEYADRYSVEFSEYLELLMAEQVSRIDEKVRSDREFNMIFLRILRSGNNVSKILLKMNEIRLLGRFIPEFARIVCMVQYDSYHVYTVDIHSIFMVREIERLINYEYEKKFPFLIKVAETLVKRHVLFLACLFHDMGKGQGGNHSQKGAAMIPKIAKRMGLSTADAEQLEFLVRHHLAMVHFSQRRDLDDPVVLKRLAKSIPDEETLSLLYLLTFADIRSVGPDIWKDWTGMLLQELYVKTLRQMSEGTYHRKNEEEWMSKMTSDIVADTDGEIPERNVRKILKKMPVSYFSQFSRQSILRHVGLLDSMEGQFATEVIPYGEYDEFTICAPDRKGIFSVFCGVLSANGLNILGARIVTTLDKKAFDVFYVDRVDHLSEQEHLKLWEKVERNLRRVLDGDVEVKELVRRRQKNYSSYTKNIPEYPPEIVFDNESSERATVIEIYAHDGEGLLYGITKTIAGLGLSIDYAKISTRADQIVDTFYVRDSRGRKISGERRLRKIENSLISEVS